MDKTTSKRGALSTRTLVLTGLFAALACGATMVLKVPSPTGGYTNLGDTVVLLSAWLLGPLWGAVAGGIGPALADLLSGYPAYVPATLLIKAAMGLLAGGLYLLLGRRLVTLPLCGAAAEAVMILGYWLFDGLLAFFSGSGLSFGLCLTGAASGIPGNLVQGAFGIAASTLLAAVLSRSSYVRREFPGFCAKRVSDAQ